MTRLYRRISSKITGPVRTSILDIINSPMDFVGREIIFSAWMKEYNRRPFIGQQIFLDPFWIPIIGAPIFREIDVNCLDVSILLYGESPIQTPSPQYICGVYNIGGTPSDRYNQKEIENWSKTLDLDYYNDLKAKVIASPSLHGNVYLRMLK